MSLPIERATPRNVPTQADLVTLARAVGVELAASGLQCAAAESCTGGLIGHIITENSGSSAYFAGSAVVYSYAAKETLLGVEPATLAAVGAVSAEVAQQMAQGALARYGADIAVSVTGIAGPGGALPGKPTGTVYLHCSAADGYEQGRHHVWLADRSGNKLLSAHAALEMIEIYLTERANATASIA